MNERPRDGRTMNAHERLRAMSDEDLSVELEGLGRALAWPPTPSLAATVVSRLERAPVSRRIGGMPFGWLARRPLRRAAVLALVVSVLAGSSLADSSPISYAGQQTRSIKALSEEDIAAAFFVNASEQHIATARTSDRAFDAVVRETTNSVAEFRADGVKKSMDALRSMATTDKAKASVDQAASKADNFTEIAAVLDQINTARTAEQQAADDTEASQRKAEATALGGAVRVRILRHRRASR